MPIYIYQHPETEEVIELIQSVNDEHVYIDLDGTKWNRVYTVPNMSVDSKTPSTREEFMDVTAKKTGTIGDMQDLSREMSEKRQKESLDGVDPVQRKYFDEYSKTRHGRRHPKDRPKKIESKNGITVEL